MNGVPFCSFCKSIIYAKLAIKFSGRAIRAKTIDGRWICWVCYKRNSRPPLLTSQWIRYKKPSVILVA